MWGPGANAGGGGGGSAVVSVTDGASGGELEGKMPEEMIGSELSKPEGGGMGSPTHSPSLRGFWGFLFRSREERSLPHERPKPFRTSATIGDLPKVKLSDGWNVYYDSTEKSLYMSDEKDRVVPLVDVASIEEAQKLAETICIPEADRVLHVTEKSLPYEYTH